MTDYKQLADVFYMEAMTKGATRKETKAAALMLIAQIMESESWACGGGSISDDVLFDLVEFNKKLKRKYLRG